MPASDQPDSPDGGVTQPGSAATTTAPETRSSADTRPLLTGAEARKEVQRIATQSRIMLNEGEEDKAREELEYAKRLDADNKEIACLLRSVTADPASVFGAESTPYTVRAGDSLGSIAQRYMSGTCDFYLLARYNNIKIPKQLAVGQALRIPGRVNLNVPQTVTTPAQPVAPKPVAPKPEAPVVEQAPAKKPAAPPEPDPRARQAEIDRTYRRGQEEYKRQNLGAAINAFDAVLRMDPNHSGARVLRQQAIELQAKLEGIKNR